MPSVWCGRVSRWPMPWRMRGGSWLWRCRANRFDGKKNKKAIRTWTEDSRKRRERIQSEQKIKTIKRSADQDRAQSTNQSNDWSSQLDLTEQQEIYIHFCPSIDQCLDKAKTSPRLELKPPRSEILGPSHLVAEIVCIFCNSDQARLLHSTVPLFAFLLRVKFILFNLLSKCFWNLVAFQSFLQNISLKCVKSPSFQLSCRQTGNSRLILAPCHPWKSTWKSSIAFWTESFSMGWVNLSFSVVHRAAGRQLSSMKLWAPMWTTRKCRRHLSASESMEQRTATWASVWMPFCCSWTLEVRHCCEDFSNL